MVLYIILPIVSKQFAIFVIWHRGFFHFFPAPVQPPGHGSRVGDSIHVCISITLSKLGQEAQHLIESVVMLDEIKIFFSN